MEKFKFAIIELVETFIVSFLVIFMIYQFIASMEVVSGASMEPNFDTGQRILVDKVSPLFKPFRRGEVVVLTPPNDLDKHYIKRIIGLPGDIIKIFECKVYIIASGEQYELKEDYLSKDTCTTGGIMLTDGRSMQLNSDEYIVLGDNRTYSVDSRYFGVVTRKELLGRVIFRFWPLNVAGFFKIGKT